MKKKSIWVIEQGEYSDYRVVGVFTSKENAESVKSAINHGSYDDATVAEWELDPCVDEINKGYNPFIVIMLKDGTVERCDQRELSGYSLSTSAWVWRRTEAPAYKGKGIPDALNANVLARNSKHAIKIANELRTKMIATGEW